MHNGHFYPKSTPRTDKFMGHFKSKAEEQIKEAIQKRQEEEENKRNNVGARELMIDKRSRLRLLIQDDYETYNRELALKGLAVL